jgi:DNA repair exonuclease SbcCD ATPase subunit
MFNRVSAFLEAIDKKTEEMADAADEEELVRAIQQQQQKQRQQLEQQQQEHHQRRWSSGPSSAASSTYHGSTSLPVPSRFATGVNNNNNGDDDGGAVTPSTPLVRASASPSLHSPAPPQSIPFADSYTRAPTMPLSLPTKLPSFRSSLAAEEENHSARAAHGVGGPLDLTVYPLSSSSVGGASSATATAAAAVPAPSPSSSAAHNSAVERLQARCTALEADKARWQQEAATYKAQCGAARDALWTAEQEIRSCRTAQREAERALATYKETSQRLLEEAQQELRRAHTASTSTAEAATTASGQPLQAELAEAREMRQRLELLQAEHTTLLAEVDRLHEDAAKAAAETQRVQGTCRQARAQVDELQLELHSAQESLEGEVAAHADTRRALRELQVQQQKPYPPQPPAGGGTSDDTPNDDEATASGGDVVQLQRELREAKQRQQMLMLQISNKQTLLDSAQREVAELKGRYNELARQFDDAQVEVAAGFRSPGVSASEYNGPWGDSGASVGGGHRLRPVGGAVGAAGAFTDNVPMLSASGRGGSGVTISAHDALKRNAAMVRLTRQYGVVGRGFVAVVSAMDVAAIRLGRVLSQARWVWRVILMGYIALLQIWVVLLVLANMAGDVSGSQYDEYWSLVTTTHAP